MDQVSAPRPGRDRHGREICLSATPALTGGVSRGPRLAGGELRFPISKEKPPGPA